jgi:hypothetical protein
MRTSSCMLTCMTSGTVDRPLLSSNAVRVRDNRLRDAARRQKAVLRKSGRKDPRALDYDRFWIVLGDGTVIGQDADGWATLTATDVEALLTRGLPPAA